MLQTRECETTGFEDCLSNIRDLPEQFANGVFFLRQQHVRRSWRSQFDKPKWLACYTCLFFPYLPWYLSLALRKCYGIFFFFRIATTAMIATPLKKTGSQRHRVFNSISVTHSVATCQVKIHKPFWTQFCRVGRDWLSVRCGANGKKIDGNRKSNYCATGDKRPLARLHSAVRFDFD